MIIGRILRHSYSVILLVLNYRQQKLTTFLVDFFRSGSGSEAILKLHMYTYTIIIRLTYDS